MQPFVTGHRVQISGKQHAHRYECIIVLFFVLYNVCTRMCKHILAVSVGGTTGGRCQVPATRG